MSTFVFKESRPQNMRELIDKDNNTRKEFITITQPMAEKCMQQAEHLAKVAAQLSLVPYELQTALFPLTPAESHSLTVAATILRKKGFDIADAVAAGTIVKKVPIMSDYVPPRNPQDQ